jgi:8-oxo-dGTP pyrophosphatase MutT (NUDIX family)
LEAIMRRPASGQPRPAGARLVFAGVLFEIWQWEQEMFDGSIATFEVACRPDTVLVLPVLDGGQVVLAEEEQPGRRRLLRALGGRVEPGESPLAAARRELREEGGYAARELRLWHAWQPVAKLDWAVYLFVAHGAAADLAPDPDPGERIQLRPVAIQDLLDPSSRLAIDDHKLLEMLYLARSDPEERERLRALLDPDARCYPGEPRGPNPFAA